MGGGGPKFGGNRNEDPLKRIPDEEVSGKPHSDDPKKLLEALGKEGAHIGPGSDDWEHRMK